MDSPQVWEGLRKQLQEEKFRCAQIEKESKARGRKAEHYKLRVHELEQKLNDLRKIQERFRPAEKQRVLASDSPQFIFYVLTLMIKILIQLLFEIFGAS